MMTGRRHITTAGALLLASTLVACNSPTAPSPWPPERLREQLLASNLNNRLFGQAGRLTRWRVPIAVNTNGIARAETALQHYEQWTSGAVRFTRVTGTPANGLLFVTGGATAEEETVSCGLVTDVAPPNAAPLSAYQWDSSRAIIGTYYIHLGSARCDDSVKGDHPSAVAEHQLAHALGLVDHFVGFSGLIGLEDPRLVSIIFNMYSNPIGATPGELVIWGSR